MDEKIKGEPPIGLKPYYVWRSERVQDIVAAMERYACEGLIIPLIWVQELKEHLNIDP